MAAKGSIRVDRGEIELEVNDQGDTIVFAADTAFMENFEEVRQEIKTLSGELQARQDRIFAEDPEAWDALRARMALMEAGQEVEDAERLTIPKNYGDRVQLEKELVLYCYGMLDKCFGADTSRKVFGDVQEMDLVIDFLEQVTPFIQAKRKEKMEKYRKHNKAKQ